jgi:hypothetical protein
MQDIITVTLKDVYGTVKAYPANVQAEKLAALVGTKTLTVQTLRLAKDMGFRLTYRDRFGSFADMDAAQLLAIA